jgi:branched-chain amino acid transport system ATP-binding protein
LKVILHSQNLTKSFGRLMAVDGMDLQIQQGNLHAIIGPNGAGKTTLFNLISGHLKRPTSDLPQGPIQILSSRQHLPSAHRV